MSKQVKMSFTDARAESYDYILKSELVVDCLREPQRSCFLLPMVNLLKLDLLRYQQAYFWIAQSPPNHENQRNSKHLNFIKSVQLLKLLILDNLTENVGSTIYVSIVLNKTVLEH